MGNQKCELYATCARMKSILKLLFAIETILVASIRSEEVIQSFRCNNGEFTEPHYFCDGGNDCDDGSDELYGCDPSCGSEKFLCEDQNCLPISVRCNGTSECQDKSDEMYCDHELKIDKDCTIEEGKFLCKDKLRCIKLRYVCNHAKNCFDGSDESDECLAPGEDLCDTCFHPCFPMPNSRPRCFCNTTNEKFDALCDEMQPCSTRLYQRCVEFQNTTYEYCVHGYRKNFLECINDVPYGKLLIYSVKGIIKVFNFTNNETREIHTTELRTAIAAAQDYIYWADISTTPEHKTSIFKTRLKSNDQIEEIINLKYYENLVNSISIDWIAGNIYFTMAELGTLSVCSFNRRICSQFKNNLNGITYVAVAPRTGLMFWTFSRSEHRVVKSHMDGSNDRIIYSNRHFSLVSLTVDEESERIYWLNLRMGIVQSAHFDRSDEDIKSFSLDVFSSIIAFSYFEKDLYFMMNDRRDEFQKKVYSKSRGSIELLVKDVLDINYIHVYNHLLQHTSIPNPCENSFCAGLCLLRPTVSKGLNYTCLCSNFKSAEDGTVYWCDELELKTESVREENIRQEKSERKRRKKTFDNDQFNDEVPKSAPMKPGIVFIIAIVLCLAGFYLGWRKFASSE